MSDRAGTSDKFRVIVAGGGVAALESVLALHELAGDRVDLRVLAPDREFVYRPMTVREPFAYARAARYELAPIVARAGAALVPGKLGRVDVEKHIVHTADHDALEYDALVLALGAQICPRYTHALTIDDRRLDETLQGLIQDVEGGYVRRIAFVSPGRMAWPLPLYELALMTAGRAYDMCIELEATIVTPEDKPLAIFGSAVADGVGALLADANIKVISSGYAEVPRTGAVVVNPGDRHLAVDRIVALPELYGPSVRGVPSGEHGFIRVNRFGRVPDAGNVYAAGDATDFPVKHGGLGAQQADAVAESIAALAGVSIEPHPFKPVIRGILMTHERPRYLAAEITGGRGFASQFSDSPIEGVTSKIAARYLGAYLESANQAKAVA